MAAEAAALAARGHRVAVLAPGSGRELVEARARAGSAAAAAGDAQALLPPPGEVAVTALARALPAGAGRRMGGPFDLAAALETALAGAAFDVVHVHEPLAPSPTLTALRHAPGVTAATFHRPEQLAGVAFLRPLVDRALARVDLRIATSEAGRRALAEVLPGDYRLIRPGIDLGHLAAPPGDPGGAAGRGAGGAGRDRVGARFGLSALRGIDPGSAGSSCWPARHALAHARRRAEGPSARRWRWCRATGPRPGRGLRARADRGLTTAADAARPPLVEAMAAG